LEDLVTAIMRDAGIIGTDPRGPEGGR
jgi:hypothetical protein